MQTEIEVKFLAVDHNVVRAALQKVGATLEQPMRLMHRSIIDYPDNRLQKAGGFIRVRNEGHRTTVTFKQFDALSIDGAREIETSVDDYKAMVALLQAAGLRVTSEQESKRETWQLDNCEVVLDEWPWLKPYIEIEGPDETSLRTVAVQLGFDWHDAVFGDVVVAYRAEYRIPSGILSKNPRISFDQPVPEWLEKARLNR